MYRGMIGTRTGKSKVTRFGVALMMATCLTHPSWLHAQVTAADGSTGVYNAPNGVPIVDIAKANASGLSHNRFTEYNVDPRGLVLNNANSDQIQRQSQLAGQIMFNPRLGSQEASVILNEVVAPNRSNLAGYTEVVGKNADVVVANPYGITCNGCGFINTPNVTLSTGAPSINGAQVFTGGHTAQGDILITGNGLDATGQDYMSLVARSVKVDGQINAENLTIAAGVGEWDHDNRTFTAGGTGTGATPAYAIDSTALGGIYAGSIRLKATEAGVGVRALGDVAASASDFSIDAAGKVQLSSRISAERDIAIATTSNDAEAIKATNATISAKRYAALASTGGTVLEGGKLVANDSLSIDSGSLNDSTTTNTAITDNNKRYGGNVATIRTSGNTTLNGTSYGADDLLAVEAGSVTVGADGATLYSDGTMAVTTTGDMNLGKAALRSEDDLALTSGGTITTTAASGQGIQSDAGDVGLTANAVNNAGVVNADNGDLVARVGALTNSGTLHAKNAGDFADKTGGATGSINNSGTLVTEGALTTKTATLTNSGSIQSNGGTHTTDTLTNSGTLQSAAAMALNITTAINNTSKIASTGDMTVRGTTTGDYAINNSGRIETAGLLDIKGKDGTKAVDITTNASSDLLGNTVDINADTVTVNGSGTITSRQALTAAINTLNIASSAGAIIAASAPGSVASGLITVTNALTNNGALHSGYDLTVNAPSITNASNGGISALHNLSANATAGDFINNGQLYAGNLLGASATGTFTNNSRIDSDLDMNLSANSFINRNIIIGKRNITISAANFENSVDGSYPIAWDYNNVTFNPGNGSDRTGTFNQDSYLEDNYYNNYEGISGGFDETHYYRATFTTSQYYVNGKPTSKPQLIGGTSGTGTLTIKDFNTGRNYGGLISSPIVTLIGNAGSTFTNDALKIVKYNWSASWNNWCDMGFTGCSWTDYRSYEKHVASVETLDSVGAGIFAGTLNGGGFSLTNEGGAQGGTVSTRNPGGASVTGLTGGINFGGLAITLPTNPNGFFVPSTNPNSRYLIETNPRFANGGGMGSDYMAKRYGVDPDNIQRRLGDAGYETSLVRDQLISQTGASTLKAGESEAQQMQRLMDNGVDQGKAMGLKFGEALKPDQIANLKEDMVWMVETEVQGQKVLAPVVYLSAATKNMFEAGGAQIAANNVNLNLTSMTNNGGSISGSQNLNITSQGDITNRSGSISGGNVNLTSTGGSINNITDSMTGGNSTNMDTVIGKTATITSTGNLNLDANKNISNIGANMNAGGNANLKAGDNITFDTIENKTARHSGDTSNSPFAGITGGGGSTTTQTTTQIKSGLTAGGNIGMDAGKDLTLAGTDVTAGGNADLKAGDNLNILSREDSTSTSTESSSSNLISSSSKTITETTTKNIASNIKAGGNLTTTSGNDTTIKGSNLEAGGNVDMDAGGNLNILAGKDTKTTSVSTSETGLGVGGGVYGSEQITDTHSQSRNVASNIKSGGNTNLKSDKTLTIQGSNVEAGGNVGIEGKDVNILEGRDTDERTTSKTTTTFLSTSSDSDSSSGSEAFTTSSTENDKAEGAAEAGAGASASGSAGLSLMDTTTTTTKTKDSKSVGSNIKSGGNTTINADNNMTIRGSTVDAGGDVSLDAKNVNITAAQDEHTSETTTTRTGIGFYTSSENEAGAGVGVRADADRGGADATGTGHGDSQGNGGAGFGLNAGEASVSANAAAGANAESDNSLDLMQHTETTTKTKDITNKGSLIKSGGKTTVKADDKLTVHGSDIEAGTDVDLKAKDMEFTAAEDSHETSTSTSTTRAGIYATAGAGASADGAGDAAAKGYDAKGEVNADAGADAGIGLQGTNTTTNTASGSTTARTSSIKAGGNIKREADNKITDVGTQIEAGGNFEQSAKEWDSQAAKNTSWESSDSTTHTARVGAYAEAGASAHAEGEAKGGVGSKFINTQNENSHEAGASAGAKASYHYGNESSSSSSSDAVVSNIKTGGNFKSTTTGKTTLEGTNIDAGGDAELNAKSLDYKAAKDTSSSRSSSTTGDGEIKVGVDASKAVTGSASGSYDNKSSSESSSTAVVGNMKSGGKLTVKTDDDARFEGTNLEAGGDAKIDAGGDLKFDAARDTFESTEESTNANAAISMSKSGRSTGAGGKKQGVQKGLNAEGGYENKSGNASSAVAGSIKSGGKLDVAAGKSATFEGTNIESGGDASIKATDDVNFNAAKSESHEQSYGANGKVQIDMGKDGKKGVVAGGHYGKTDDSTEVGSTIKSGGKLKVEGGKDVNLVGTSIESEGKTTLKAGEDVNFRAAEDKHESVNANMTVTVGKTDALNNPDTETHGYGKINTTKKAQTAKETGVEGGVSYEKSNTKKVGSVNAGSLDVQSGNDTTFEGTNIITSGDTNIDAGGKVKFDAAKSSDFDMNVGGSLSAGDGLLINDAGMGGSDTRTGSDVKTGGDFNIKSGDGTTMTGTHVDSEGTVDIEGDLEKQDAVSGGGQIGLGRVGAGMDVRSTDINAKGGVNRH